MSKIKRAPNVWITEKDKTTGDLSSYEFKTRGKNASYDKSGSSKDTQPSYPVGGGDFNDDFSDDFFIYDENSSD